MVIDTARAARPQSRNIHFANPNSTAPINRDVSNGRQITSSEISSMLYPASERTGKIEKRIGYSGNFLSIQSLLQICCGDAQSLQQVPDGVPVDSLPGGRAGIGVVRRKQNLIHFQERTLKRKRLMLKDIQGSSR